MTFQCSRCEESFSDMESFLRHMREVHGRGPVDTGGERSADVRRGGRGRRRRRR